MPPATASRLARDIPPLRAPYAPPDEGIARVLLASANRSPEAEARIDARARRYAVKLFLAHLHGVWFWMANGTLPPKPYIIEHGGHTHVIQPPNMPDGMQAALQRRAA